MNLRIEQVGQDYLIVDGGTLDQRTVIDAYPTRAEAENFLQFIGQSEAGQFHVEHGETCAMCGAPGRCDATR
jgi:hypothetical protein